MTSRQTRAAAAALACALLASGPGAPPARAQLAFEDLTDYFGIDAVCMTYGPTWGDYDDDGFCDVFIGNHYSRQPMLLNNLAGQDFVDRLNQVGIPHGGDRHGAAWGDFNNDGWPDLYVAVGGSIGPGTGYNQLYMNSLGETFLDVASSAGVLDSLGRGRFPYWVDVDGDGWLDLFVGNEASPNQLFLNQRNRAFAPLPEAGQLGAEELWFAAWTRWNGDRHMDVALAGNYTHALRLYRGTGTGTFVDVTASTGLPPGLEWVQGLCWLDYDNDGDQDLYASRGWASDLRDAVLSSEESLAFLFHMPEEQEEEDGLDGVVFACAAESLLFDVTLNSVAAPERVFLGAAGVHPPEGPFTLADGQALGRPAFAPGFNRGCYIWQEEAGGSWFVHCSTGFASRERFGALITPCGGALGEAEWIGLEPPACPADLSDRLYRNEGDGTFLDVTEASGIHNPESARTAISADFDCDGWIDLYVVNEREVDALIARNMPNCLFRNNGDGTFTESAAAGGVTGEVPGTGASAAWGDFDNDGFPDLYLTNGWSEFPFNLGPHKFYRNLGNAHHWIELRLEGTLSNRDAIGARVRVVAGGLAQTRVQTGGVNDMAQSSTVIHFGLGQAALVDTLSIHWPSGIYELRLAVPADTLLYWIEPETAAAPAAADSSRGAGLRITGPGLALGGAALHYRLPSPGGVQASIWDAQGRLVRALWRGWQTEGEQVLAWDGRDAAGRAMPAGVYFARLTLSPAARATLQARGRIVLAR